MLKKEKGHIWKTMPHNVTKNKNWCPTCNGSPKAHTEEDRKNDGKALLETAMQNPGSCVYQGTC